MDLALHIIKHTNEIGTISYSARLAIGRPDLHLDAHSEEVFRVGATGKSFFACITAIKERALMWAETKSITCIIGLTDNKPCSLMICGGKEDIEIVPVTYNDWLVQSKTPTKNYFV